MLFQNVCIAICQAVLFSYNTVGYPNRAKGKKKIQGEMHASQIHEQDHGPRTTIPLPGTIPFHGVHLRPKRLELLIANGERTTSSTSTANVLGMCGGHGRRRPADCPAPLLCLSV